jgi:hypothetical protein
MKRWQSLAPALMGMLALGYLSAMIASGAMPVQRQLSRFEAKGLLTLPPERIHRVELRRGGEQLLTLRRAGDTEWTTADGRPIGAAAALVGTALTMMRNAGPVREIDAAELSGIDTAPFGLDPPRLSAALYAEGEAPVLTAGFGERNPEGYLQYMRIDGDARLFLMSRFVGAEWDAAMTAAAGP